MNIYHWNSFGLFHLRCMSARDPYCSIFSYSTVFLNRSITVKSFLFNRDFYVFLGSEKHSLNTKKSSKSNELSPNNGHFFLPLYTLWTEKWRYLYRFDRHSYFCIQRICPICSQFFAKFMRKKCMCAKCPVSNYKSKLKKTSHPNGNFLLVAKLQRK